MIFSVWMILVLIYYLIVFCFHKSEVLSKVGEIKDISHLINMCFPVIQCLQLYIVFQFDVF
jgi:hypothetical protein